MLAAELVEKLQLSNQEQEDSSKESEPSSPVSKKKKAASMAAIETPLPLPLDPLLGILKNNPSFVSTTESLLWKIEEENLGRLFIVLRKTQGIRYAVKCMDGHCIEVVIVSILEPSEFKVLSEKLGNIPQTMVQNWFKSSIKSMTIISKHPTSIGNLLFSNDVLEVYEFLLTQ